MLMALFALYIGIGVGWTYYDDEYWGFEEFVFSVISWPFAMFEGVTDFLGDGLIWICECFDDLLCAIGDQFESIMDWFFDRFDRRDNTSTYYKSDGDLDINIQAGGDIRVNGELQSRDRSQRKNKKSAEVVDLQKNPLD